MEGSTPVAELERLLAGAVEQTDRPFLILNPAAEVIYANPAFTRLLGYTVDDLRGSRPSDLIASPRMSADALARYRGRRWGHDTFYEDALVLAKDRRDISVRVHSAPLDIGDPDLAGYSVVVMTDITVDGAIRGLEREALAALASDLPFDELGALLCQRIEAITADVLVSISRVREGRLSAWAAPSFPESYAVGMTGVEIGEGVASCGTSAARGELVMVDDIDTDPLWAPYKDVVVPAGLRACWSYPVKRSDGSVSGTFACYFRDPAAQAPFLSRVAEASIHLCALAIEREEIRERLGTASRTDALTGLPNRDHWYEEAARQRSLQVAPSAVACLDVDRLADINRALGYLAGDRTIVAVAGGLASQLAPGELLGRIERDRFVILLPGLDAEAALTRVRELRRRLDVSVPIDGRAVPVTMTAGISLFPRDGRSPSRLVENALDAARRARERGVSEAVFDEALEGDAHERLLVGDALTRAIEQDTITQWYQPQVGADGSLHGVEALSRWRDADLGAVSPLRFIPLAEELGKSPAFDRLALARACGQLARWRADGVDIPTVSVNVAPMTLAVPDLAGYLAGLLRDHAIEPGRLTVELTERATGALPAEGVTALSMIRALGVGVSVDDFGTGFSSLSNLVTLPVTEVKIDRSFVEASTYDARSRALVEAIIEIGSRLGLHVVAEGVETKQQHDLLAELGGPVEQGYLHAAAMSAEDLATWVAARK